MRNIKCGVADIRKRVFAEVAKLAYEGGDYTRIESCPMRSYPVRSGGSGNPSFWSAPSWASGSGWLWDCPCVR